MSNYSLLANRVAVLATMHRKEETIGSILDKELGVQVIVPPGINTDEFGTFTRDKERLGTQVEAARLKAQKALALTGETLGLASEGSFSPHPLLPAIAINREIVILIDKLHDLEIIGEVVTTETNYRHKIIASWQEAQEFAERIGFPEHGLVVFSGNGEIVKGITHTEHLRETVEELLRIASQGKVQIETDMRALYNPTRMKAIAQATHNLISKINSVCPQCQAPGFAETHRKKGLPCSICSLPTSFALVAIYECQKCHHTQEKMFPEGIEAADPTYCSYCNP